MGDTNKNIVKAQFAMDIKLMVSGDVPPTHNAILDRLHTKTGQYIAHFKKNPNQERHSPGERSGFLKLTEKIENILEADLRRPLETPTVQMSPTGR